MAKSILTQKPFSANAFENFLDLIQNGEENEILPTLKGLDNINRLGKEGFAPIHVACKVDEIKIVRIMVEFSYGERQTKIDINLEAKNGETALHIATRAKSEELIRYLVSKGANIEAKTREGFTALHLAINDSNRRLTQHLMKFEANVNALDNEGVSCLQKAAQKGSAQLLNFLLNVTEIDVDYAMPDSGNTALHMACELGHEECALSLMSMNARQLANEQGQLPILIAVEKGLLNVVTWYHAKHGLLNARNPITGFNVLHTAVASNKIQIVRFWITQKLDMTQCTNNGLNAMHLATIYASDQVVSLLAEHAISLINTPAEQTNQTPLHCASEHGRTNIVQLLVGLGAAIDAATSDGDTALHIVARTNHDDTAAMLVCLGASLVLVNKQNKSALAVAKAESSVNDRVVDVLTKTQVSEEKSKLVQNLLMQQITLLKSKLIHVENQNLNLQAKNDHNQQMFKKLQSKMKHHGGKNGISGGEKFARNFSYHSGSEDDDKDDSENSNEDDLQSFEAQIIGMTSKNRDENRIRRHFATTLLENFSDIRMTSKTCKKIEIINATMDTFNNFDEETDEQVLKLMNESEQLKHQLGEIENVVQDTKNHREKSKLFNRQIQKMSECLQCRSDEGLQIYRCGHVFCKEHSDRLVCMRCQKKGKPIGIQLTDSFSDVLDTDMRNLVNKILGGLEIDGSRLVKTGF